MKVFIVASMLVSQLTVPIVNNSQMHPTIDNAITLHETTITTVATPVEKTTTHTYDKPTMRGAVIRTFTCIVEE